MYFPYIKQIHVIDCYTYQNFRIPSKAVSEFKHIILTGKNGTGKTTILSRIAFILSQLRLNHSRPKRIATLKGWISTNKTHSSKSQWLKELMELESLDLFFLDKTNVENEHDVEVLFSDSIDFEILKSPEEYIFSFFKAYRKVDVRSVTTVTKEESFLQKLKDENNPEKFAGEFKQYLVNKKVYEAFDFMSGVTETRNQNHIFFDKLEGILQKIFDNKKLKLIFLQENFEFEIELDEARRITFNQMSEGFSAFISIVMDLIMRVDLIRKDKGDYSLDPPGIVLIDEPETHFHIEMQYQILPLLTELFPKIQFIIATHSPAIISSIKNAIVFDLTSRIEISGWQVGSSYSELMVKHFGLDNEFSLIADSILFEVTDAVQKNDIIKLDEILHTNEKYLTSSLRFEIENQIIAIKSKRG